MKNVRTIDPLDLVGQERAEASRKDEQDQIINLEAEDFKWLMSDKRGRRFVYGLLERTNVYRSSFTGNSTTFFNEGMRNVGLDYLAQINEHCPDRYNQMITERKDYAN